MRICTLRVLPAHSVCGQLAPASFLVRGLRILLFIHGKENRMIPDEISNLSLARCLEISERRVAEVRGQGRLPVSEAGHIDLRSLIRRGWQASLEGPDALPANSRRSGAIPVLADERAKREAAEAALAEIRLQEKQRELLKASAVSEAATSVMGRAMARFFDAWPEVSVELARMNNPAAIADRLADEQRRVMAGIHKEFMEDAAKRSTAGRND